MPKREKNPQNHRQPAQKKRDKIVQKATKRTKYKKVKKSLKKVLTKGDESGIIYKLSRRAHGEVIEN